MMKLSLDSLPSMDTKRLHLRPLAVSDVDDFRKMTDQPSIIGAVHFLKSPFTKEDAESLLRGAGDGRDCFWGVWLRHSLDIVGTVGTHFRGELEIEIGYWFSQAVQGRGYATESVRAVVAALAIAFPARSIFAECRPENAASWRLLERIGFTTDGESGNRPGRMKLTYIF